MSSDLLSIYILLSIDRDCYIPPDSTVYEEPRENLVGDWTNWKDKKQSEPIIYQSRTYYFQVSTHTYYLLYSQYIL